MASTQQPKGANKPSTPIPERHQAKLNELHKKAQEETTKLKSTTKSQAKVHCKMWNNTPGLMPFQENMDWSGSVIGEYPPNIDPNREASFTNCGNPPADTDGSYGAVIYTGTNQPAGVADNCAWVLAWHVPGDDTTPNKVYVECGPISNYPKGKADWKTIKASLDGSSNVSYFIDDNNTHAEATASITATGDITTIAVAFDINN